MDDGKKSSLILRLFFTLVAALPVSLIWTWSSNDWFSLPKNLKLSTGFVRLGTTAVLLFLVITILDRIIFTVFESVSKKNRFAALFLAAFLAIFFSFSALFYLPNALQPTNRLQISYDSAPENGFPIIGSHRFDDYDSPTRYLPDENGVPGLMAAQQEAGKIVLKGQFNFIGDLSITVPEGAALPDAIIWNGRLLDSPSFEPLLTLQGNRNPFANKPAWLSLFLVLWLISWVVVMFGWIIVLACIIFLTLLVLTKNNLSLSIQKNRIITRWKIGWVFLSFATLINPLMILPIADRILWLMGSLIVILQVDPEKVQPALGKYASRKVTAALFFGAFWFAMMFAGNSLLISLRTTNLQPPLAIISFLLCWTWAFLPIFSFISVLEWLQKRTLRAGSVNPRRIWLIRFFLIFIVVFTSYLIAYNPAISSMDSQGQWWQATGITQMDDAHSPFHTLYIRALIAINPHPLLISIVQIVWLSLIAAFFLNWLRNRGVPTGLLFGFALVLAIMPNNGLTVITVWKDVPYTISLLWLTFLLVRLLLDAHQTLKSKWLIAEVAVCLIFVCQFRHNGLLPGYLTALFLILFSVIRKAVKPAVGVGTFFVLMLLINGPLYKALNVISMDSQQIVTSLAAINDILAVKKLGGTLPEQTRSLLDDLFDDPDSADFSFFQNDTTWRRVARWETVTPTEILVAYGRTALKNPLTFLRALSLRLDFLWALRESPYGGFSDNVNWTDADLAGFPRIPNGLKPLADRWLGWIRESPLYPFVWRGGIYLAFLFVVFIFLAANRRVSFLFAALPYIGNTLSLYLGTYPAVRYTWHATLIFGFLLFSFALRPVTESPPENPIKY